MLNSCQLRYPIDSLVLGSLLLDHLLEDRMSNKTVNIGNIVTR